MRRLTARALLAAALLPAAGPAPAQGVLADPTRPPAMTAPRAAPPAGAVAVPPPRPLPPPPAPLLQSVQLGRAGAPDTALVDGRLVRVGDRVGDALVLAIDLDGLVLQGARGTQRLRLLGAAIVQSPATAPALAVRPLTPTPAGGTPLAATGEPR